MIAQAYSQLTRAQRYALGKVASRTIEGKITTVATYPKYSGAFAHLDTLGFIEMEPSTNSYRLTISGAREILAWPYSARPVDADTLRDFIHDEQERRDA